MFAFLPVIWSLIGGWRGTITLVAAASIVTILGMYVNEYVDRARRIDSLTVQLSQAKHEKAVGESNLSLAKDTIDILDKTLDARNVEIIASCALLEDIKNDKAVGADEPVHEIIRKTLERIKGNSK